jgi:hypothetical protein
MSCRPGISGAFDRRFSFPLSQRGFKMARKTETPRLRNLLPPGYYVVIADVKNPTPDRRARDWHKQATIKAGTILRISDRDREDGRLSRDYSFHAADNALEEALYPFLAPLPMTTVRQCAAALGESLSGHFPRGPSDAAEVFARLVDAGIVTVDRIRTESEAAAQESQAAWDAAHPQAQD